uniref:PurM-like N-terminal domain-containing protein n=1 Tax=Glossina austeni TaxID=7395 RepID=A0A1A9UKE8_GLOAU
MDTLVLNTHFLEKICPFDLGYKSVSVNLSDLAAMGASPKWLLLSLTTPYINESWISKYSKGLFHNLNKFDVKLIGGDLNKGPLSITINAQGTIPKNNNIKMSRYNAKIKDLIYVTGTLGDSSAGLSILTNNLYVQDKHTIYVCDKTTKDLKYHDHPSIVLDEFVVNSCKVYTVNPIPTLEKNDYNTKIASVMQGEQCKKNYIVIFSRSIISDPLIQENINTHTFMAKCYRDEKEPSLGVNPDNTSCVAERKLSDVAESKGKSNEVSSIKSPRCESSSSPIGVSIEIDISSTDKFEIIVAEIVLSMDILGSIKPVIKSDNRDSPFKIKPYCFKRNHMIPNC